MKQLKQIKSNIASAGEPASYAEGNPGKKNISLMADRILVIDDEPGIRDLLSYELRHSGYVVETAANGLEAMELLKGNKFHLVISDMKMPQMNGIDTLKAIKQIDPEIEVIITTGYATIENAVTAMKEGAYDYVQKPFNMHEIMALIQRALERRELKALVALYDASKLIFSSVHQEQLFPTVADLLARVLKADFVCMWTWAEGRFFQKTAAGGAAGDRAGFFQTFVKNASARLASLREPLLTDKNGNTGATSVFFPLIQGKDTIGLVVVERDNPKNSFTSNDLRMLTIFCSYIIQAISNTRLYASLEEKIGELKTSNQKLEETHRQLMQSEKLAAVGQLAAGVAHELNNPLTGILGFAQLLLRQENFTEQQREDLEGIHAESQRCRKIIQNLLQFSRRSEAKKEPVSVVPLLESSLELVDYHFFTSGMEVTRNWGKSIGKVFAEPSQLQQVFLNIMTNAKQATEGKKGKLLIEAFQKGLVVTIRFKDNGVGISPEDLTKIFDPFFSTKPVGKGTGLGLSISYGIIQEHQGRIWAESKIGEGTSLVIELPVYAE